MAKNRFINTRFWSDSFISELNPLDRYLFLYLLTNEHTNICGIYELPIKVMSNETGIEKDMLEKMFKRLKGKVWHIDGWVYLKNFERHQVRNESVKMGIEKAKELVPLKIALKIRDIDSVPQRGDSGGTDWHLSELESESKLEYEKESNSETSSPEIPLLIKSFESLNPASKKFYGNKTQREACRFLIETYGLERIQKIVEQTLPKTNVLQYFPTITTPLQLQDKFSALESAIKKYQSEKQSITNKNKVAF